LEKKAMKKVAVLSICSFLFLLITNAHAALIGSWDFNEGFGNVAHDISGNGNHASGLTSGWIPGKYASGTTSDNIIVQPDPSLLLSSSLSIGAWINMQEFNGLQRRIVEMAPDYGFLFNPPTMYGLEFQKPALGEWFHAAITWDGSMAQFYYNGIPATPVVAQTTIVQHPNLSLYMGYPGYILDEVRIYNHVLTRNEILRDMNFDSTGSAVPEPASLLLLSFGLLGAGLLKRRIKK
jgi:hypothetical protein